MPQSPDRKSSASLVGESGSAVVEFIMLGLLLLVPVVYFVATMGVLQGAAFAAVGAADHAAKVFVEAPTAAAARSRAQEVVRLAAQDFGMGPAQGTVNVSCSRTDCLEPGGAVTVTVAIETSLPWASEVGGPGVAFGRVEASSTQLVGRFR